MTTTVLRSTGRRSPSKWGDVDPATELAAAAAAAEMTASDDAGIKAADRSSVTGDRKNGPSPLDNGGGTGRSPGGRGATDENTPGLGRMTAEGTREQGAAALDRPKQGRPEPERHKPAEQQERDLRRAEASLLFLKKGTRKTVPNGFKS
jgi:hypothetical protein